MNLEGKGFFIWNLRDCYGGAPQAIAAAARQAGLTHVLIKVADRFYPHNVSDNPKTDLVPPVADALRAEKIAVWGWHYVYGYEPGPEARIAVQRIRDLGLDGYVVDAEGEYKLPGRGDSARRYMHDLRSAFPDLPVALSSYRFPSLHPALPWGEFLSHCDLSMPQVYWEKAHNPADQIARTLREYRALNPQRPVIPTGPAYKANGWRPTIQDTVEFLDAVRKAGLPAANFFSWDECLRQTPEIWQAVVDYAWGGPPPITPPPPPPLDIVEAYVNALNSRNPEQLAQLYRSDAVQVTATRTIKGAVSIAAWFRTLLDDVLPGAVFRLGERSGSPSSRHFHWSAESPRGKVLNGSDTFGLAAGKIAYHFSAYTVTRPG